MDKITLCDIPPWLRKKNSEQKTEEQLSIFQKNFHELFARVEWAPFSNGILSRKVTKN